MALDLDLVTVVGWATILVTFISMASGFPLCLNMYLKRSTKNVPYVLFLVFALVSALALQYGYLSNNNVLIIINSVSLLVWGAYICVYLLVSKSKTGPFLQLLFVLGLHWAHALYLKMIPVEDVVGMVGKYLLVWSTVLYVLPITDAIEMVKTKSNDCCDLTMLGSVILSTCTWYLFGVLVNDFYVYLPSYPGIAVCGIKLFLYFYYKREPKRVTRTFFKSESINEEIVTDFHKEIYKVNARGDLRQRF